NDGKADSNVGTVTITITAVNDASVAVNDSYTTNEDTALIVSAAQGVLTNETDIDSPQLTSVLVTGPQQGSLALNAHGAFTYTAAANYFGADSFSYQAYDGQTNSNVATVTITIIPNNTAPMVVNDNYITNEDTALIVAATGGVLSNDTDADGDTLTAMLN